MSLYLDPQHASWVGRILKDQAGHKIGKVEDIYTDDDTGQPEWLSVTTGLFGSNVSFVPVAGATALGDDELQVQFPKEQVKDAPNAGSDDRLSPEEEARLYAHYGYDYDQERVRLQRWAEASPSSTTMGTPGGFDDEQVQADPLPPSEPLLEPHDDRRRVGDELGTRPPQPTPAWEDDQAKALTDRRPDPLPTRRL